MDLEFHQLDLRYESLRIRHPKREKRLLASLSDAPCSDGWKVRFRGMAPEVGWDSAHSQVESLMTNGS